MRLLHVTLPVGLWLMLACSSVGTGPEQRGRPFAVAPTKVDLGHCFVGDSRRVDLMLTNSSAQPVALAPIEVSCGCQSLELDGEPLARDLAGGMQATLLPGRHRLVMTVAPPRAGEQHVAMRITGAGHVEHSEFRVVAQEELSVEPPCVVLAGLRASEVRAFTADVVSADGKPFALQIQEVSESLEEVAVSMVGPGRARVRGLLTPRARGPGTADVRIRTDRKFADWVYVVLRWDIPEPCTVEPPALVFGVVRVDVPEPPRELLVATPAHEPAPVCEIDVTPRGAVRQVGDPSVEIIGERRLTRFFYAPAATGSRGPIRGRVIVRSGNEEIEVPVSGLVTDSR